MLHEAADKHVPLYERLRFAAIFTSNLDEFYMVRAGALDSLAHAPGDAPDSNCGWTAAEQLARIREATGALYAARDDVIEEIEGRLGKYGVSRLRPRDLEGAERAWLDRYFEEEVRPQLSVARPGEPFPHLENGGLVVALWLGEPDSEERALGLVTLRGDLPPLIRLPGEGMRFVLAGQLVRDYAPGLFPGLAVSSRAVIRVTRSADIAPDGSGDYRERVRQSLGSKRCAGCWGWKRGRCSGRTRRCRWAGWGSWKRSLRGSRSCFIRRLRRAGRDRPVPAARCWDRCWKGISCCITHMRACRPSCACWRKRPAILLSLRSA